MSREGKALFWYVAREDYALFDMSREKITRFFDVSREMDPRASSGKFLHVKSRYPESFMFLGLYCGDQMLVLFLWLDDNDDNDADRGGQAEWSIWTLN